MAEAAALLATVTGHDIQATNDGRFRILEGTAPERIISMVNPQARHGHKLRIRQLALLGGVERPCRAVRCCRDVRIC